MLKTHEGSCRSSEFKRSAGTGCLCPGLSNDVASICEYHSILILYYLLGLNMLCMLDQLELSKQLSNMTLPLLTYDYLCSKT